MVHLEMNHLEAARKELEPLSEEFPTDSQVCFYRGRLARDADRMMEAETWFRKAFEASPYDGIICYNYALCLEANGKAEEAKSIQARNAEITKDQETVAARIQGTLEQPTNPELRLDIARLLLKNQRTEAARDWALTALELTPQNPNAHELLMQCYLKLGDPIRAEKHRNMLQELKK